VVVSVSVVESFSELSEEVLADVQPATTRSNSDDAAANLVALFSFTCSPFMFFGFV
jgi:hypothetical protein